MISELAQAFHSPLAQFSGSNTHFDLPSQFENGFDTGLVLKNELSLDSSPKRIGIVFSGGPAPGGHDVLVGLLSHLRKGDELIGFLGGFGGLLQGRYFLIDPMDVPFLDGSGGFDYLGTDRTKISTDDQFNTIKSLFNDLDLDIFIVVGGDDSNTNATFLAQALQSSCHVIGVPKTIDGDLQMMPHLQVTFGFHSATQHYSKLVYDLAIDSLATGKYFHFVKLMGRNASHVTLEVAHQVHPHACLLSEEVLSNQWGLVEVVDYFTQIIMQRIQLKKPYGILIFPEGLADVIPELNAYLNGDDGPLKLFFKSMGQGITDFGPIHHDSHGNKNFSALPLERILMDCVSATINQKHQLSIQTKSHFFGYESRSSQPTEFDSIYSKLLGKTAYELGLSGCHGVIAGCDFSDQSVRPCGLPLPALMSFDSEKSRWLIKKTLVDVNDRDYLEYKKQKTTWVLSDPTFPRIPFMEMPKRFLG